MEQYIYLGKAKNIFFLSHYISDYEKYTKEIDFEILNCLISQNFTESSEDNCVIFTSNFKTKKLDIIVIYQNSKKVISKYQNSEFARQISKLVNIDRDHKIFIISYDYKTKKYLYSEEDLKLKSQELDEKEIEIGDVIYINTNKEIL